MHSTTTLDSVWRLVAGCSCWLALLAGTAAAQTSAPSSTPLGIGQPAPPLKIAAWVKGEPVAVFEPGRIYVISFWGSWSPPSLPSIYKLNKLQRDHGDQLRVIGVTAERRSSLDRFLRRTAPSFEFSVPASAPTIDPLEQSNPSNVMVPPDQLVYAGPDLTVKSTPTEEAETDSSAVRSWGETIQYTLAVDDGRQTSHAYLKGAGIDHLPTVFIVGRDGQLEWWGHPNQLDGPIQELIAGSWNRDAYWNQNRAQLELNAVLGDIEDSLVRGDMPTAIAACQKHVELHPENEKIKQLMAALQGQYVPLSSAVEEWERRAAASWDNPAELNELAWYILTQAAPELRGDGSQAMRIAARAYELTGRSDAAITDTLARAYYVQGDLENAIRLQSSAVAMSFGDFTATMTATLRQYEAELQAQRGQQAQQVFETSPVPVEPPTDPLVAPAPPLPESN